MGERNSVRRALRAPVSRWVIFLLEATADLALVAASFLIAFGLVAGFKPAEFGRAFSFGHLPLILLPVALLFWRGLYSVNPRYLGLHDFLNVAGVCFALAIPVAYVEAEYKFTGLTTGVMVVPLLFSFLATGALTGVRVLRRALAWRRTAINSVKGEARVRRRRTLIVGAGDAGETIVREFTRGRHLHSVVVGFVDDDERKQTLRIHGLPVLGKVEDIPRIAERNGIEEIFIAMPTASGDAIRRVYRYCSETSARVRTLPGLFELLDGSRLSSHLREVQIEDLLRREPVKPNMEEISKYLRGEHVLITGGGGSIGSELARQIARIGPASLTLVGKGENSIYEIEQELRQTTNVDPNTAVADVRDKKAMERVFERYRPTVVFHAAAHKHVPLMQKNPAEAIRNNILGTLHTAELAIKYGVKKFILISTDKAVNPSSIMGATKRVCEMVVCALGQRSEVQFAAVRFGNVLGSRGSLIPLLKSQIRRGGPVTVTHKDMTRFFMTIPEAVSLVTQAGAIGTSGEVFILDMGEPVRIEELALELIRMHGLVPGDDIEVRYTGIRPGEKLHEELLYGDEDLKATSHPKIQMVADVPYINMKALRSCINHLVRLCDAGDDELSRQYLMELASGKIDLNLWDDSGDRDSSQSYVG